MVQWLAAQLTRLFTVWGFDSPRERYPLGFPRGLGPCPLLNNDL